MVELRSALPVTLSLVFAACLALGACRFGADVVLPNGGVDQATMLAALMAVVALPLTAELLEADWRRGTARTLQALPVGQASVLGAKLGAGALALGAGFVLLWVVDSLLVVAEPLPDFDVMCAVDVSALVGATEFMPLALVLCWIGVVTTGLVAVVFRHALGATLIGGIAALAPLGIPYAVNSGAGTPKWARNFMPDPAYSLLALLATLAALSVIVALCFRLRGLGARSTVRRGLAVAGLLLSIPAFAVASSVVAWRLEAAPHFDDPRGFPLPLRYEAASANGDWMLIEMVHRGRRSQLTAIWHLNTETLEVRGLPDVSAELGYWWPSAIIGGASYCEGSEVLGCFGRGPGFDSDQPFAVETTTGAVCEVEALEFINAVAHGGWDFERPEKRDPDRTKRTVQARRGKTTVALNCWRTPVVPRRAPHLFFYTNGAGLVICFDAETEDHLDLGIDNPDQCGMVVSPDGEWLIVGTTSIEAKGPRLFETATGRWRGVPGFRFNTPGGRYPILGCSNPELSEWTRIGLDDEITFTTEEMVDSMVSIGESRWLGRNDNGGIYVFALDGSLIKTLREPNPEVQP